MTGLFYKDLKMCKNDYVTVLILQILVTIVVIYLTIISKADLTQEVIETLVLSKMLIYYLDLFFVSKCNTEIMSKDEQKNWHVFINSVPNGKKLQVRSKYLSVLFMYIVVVSYLFILDAITVAICNSVMIDVAIYLVMFLSIILFLDALQLPFIIGFGASHGQSIKSIFFAVIIFLFTIYFLFGDISFLQDEELERRILAFLNSEKTIYVIALMPYVTAFLYWLSYRISLLLYKKEGSNYEE